MLDIRSSLRVHAVLAMGLLLACAPWCRAAKPTSLPPKASTAAAAAAAVAAADPVQKAMMAAIDTVKPALVRIHVVEVSYYSGREMKSEGYGSGVIIDPRGYVITNHHVAGNAKQIVCTLASKEEISAKLIGTDALSDIAVLQLCPKTTKTPRQFPAAKFGDSSALRVGDRVFAMGSPLAFSQSVTMGVISNTELIMPEIFGDESLTLDGEDVGSIVRWIGHDAEIFPGNSGGPLVNMQGQIIGINEISIGLGGAIPGNLATKVAQELIAHGKTTRSWLGINIQPLLKSSPVKNGLLIADTMPDSPADKAGFRSGDVLIRLDKKPIDVRFKEELPLFNQQVMDLPIGKPVTAVVVREGKEVVLTVTPNERPVARTKTEEFVVWGICASDPQQIPGMPLTPEEEGILVESVRTGSPADDAKPSLTDGDIIQQINGKPVRNLRDLSKCVSELQVGDDGEITALVSFRREEEQMLTVIKITTTTPQVLGREVRRPWLPVTTQVLTDDLAKALNLEGRTGVRVTQVYPDSAASKAGVQVGDIITAIDGARVEASRSEDSGVLAAMIRKYKSGAAVKLTVLRDQTEQQISVELPEAPKPSRELKKYEDINYEFTARDIGFTDRVHNNLAADQGGAIIESIGEGGWAALGRLRTGDLLYMVNEKAVNSVDDLTTAMDAIAKARPDTIVLQVKRRGSQTVFLEIPGSWQQTQ